MPYLRAEQAAGLVAHPLGAAHRQAQAVEIAGLAGARILVDEGVGGQQDGGAGLADPAHDLARLQRGGMAHHLHPRDQRQQHADRQSETMKDGQGIEQHVAVVKIDMGAHLGDIGQQIFVAKRHALGFAFGAGGEKDRRGFLWDRAFAASSAGQQPAGQPRPACR